MKNFGLRPFLFFAASAGAADTATAAATAIIAAAAAKAAWKYLQGAGIRTRDSATAERLFRQPSHLCSSYYCLEVDALSSFSQASLLYIFRVAYAICLLFFLYRIFLQYNKILNELHSPLKSYEYTYHTTSLFFHIYSKGPTGISILYYG